MQQHSALDNISIVLVRTKTPGNIGAVARCMMNMGLSQLVLVRPPKDPDSLALKFAAGADRIIEASRRCAALDEAVAGHQLVIGTSRRRSRLRKNVHSPRALAEAVVPLLGSNRIAVVFGPEVDGLEKSHLALCQEIVAIPSSDAFPSLNLSHAVMVVAYELFIASLGNAGPSAPSLADAAELEGFFVHLQQTLEHVGFLDRNSYCERDRMMFSLRQIFGRARLEPRDVSILRGVLSAAASPRRPKVV
ncbi:MAG: RNA methyltransferase [Nitrospirota bacterium]